MVNLEVDIFALTLIIFTLIMIKRNIKFYHHNGNYLFLSGIFAMIIIALEILEFNLNIINNPSIVWLRYFVNIVGFGFAPLIPYFLVLFCDKEIEKKPKLRNILLIPFAINLLLCILSAWFGLVFYFEGTEYKRGPIFIVVSIICMLYVLILLYRSFIDKSRFARREFFVLMWSLIIVIACSSIQLLFGELHTIWFSISIGLFVYYVFIRDMQFEYDIMTELKNRGSYEKDLIDIKKENKVTIIVYDINNLKQINDTLGHSSGDEAITEVAKSILLAFGELGESYRIGGDEFVTLCSNVEDNRIDKAIKEFNYNIEKVSLSKEYDLHVPYGISYFYNNAGDIVDNVKEADIKMYECKKVMKENKYQ